MHLFLLIDYGEILLLRKFCIIKKFNDGLTKKNILRKGSPTGSLVRLLGS